MKLVNIGYGISIDFREGVAETLVVEHPLHLTDLVSQLYAQTDGEAGEYVLSDQDKELSFGKYVEIVANPFRVEMNDRRMLNRLYADLQSIAEGAALDKASVNASLVNLLDDVIARSAYFGIEHRLDFSWDALFRMYEVRMEEHFDSLAERITEYLKILSDYFGIRLAIFLHLHDYLSPDEMSEIYKTASYRKLHLLLIEAREHDILPDENVRIIDRDRCLIEKTVKY